MHKCIKYRENMISLYFAYPSTFADWLMCCFFRIENEKDKIAYIHHTHHAIFNTENVINEFHTFNTQPY